MKKYVVMILSLLFCFALAGCGTTSTDETSPSGSGTPEINSGTNPETNSETETTPDMTPETDFQSEKPRDDDGEYRIVQRSLQGNIASTYFFGYSPIYDTFSAGLLLINFGTITMYDTAIVTFSWGQFQNGIFNAEHELDSIAKIKFSYYNLNFINNNLGSTFSYVVQSNTFVNLTEKTDIDTYAAEGYAVLQLAINYMNTVLYAHGLQVTLY